MVNGDEADHEPSGIMTAGDGSCERRSIAIPERVRLIVSEEGATAQL